MKIYSRENLLDNDEQVIYRTNIPVEMTITKSLLYIRDDEDIDILALQSIVAISITCKEFDIIEDAKWCDCQYYSNRMDDHRLALKLVMAGGDDNNIMIFYDSRDYEEMKKFVISLKTVWPSPNNLSKRGLYPV